MTGSYDLRRGDDDAERKWDGAVRNASAPATIADDKNNAVATTAPVHDLQRDLRRVGILLGPEPSGTFDLPTEWSVREFQIYAKMERVAKEDTASGTPAEYVERLSAVPTGKHRYAGPVSGVYNAATRAAMTHWIAQPWRCPGLDIHPTQLRARESEPSHQGPPGAQGPPGDQGPPGRR